MATARAEATYRRAVVMMTFTSFLVPAAGLITAPLLAHALDAHGRGQLAAALAPAGLMLAAATMGLPDALTFYIAKRPEITRRALTWTSLITLALGTVCVIALLVVLPFLESGNAELGRLILLAAVLTIPALVVGVFRGAAVGRQMWRAVATERFILTGGRVIVIVALYVSHHLTVTNAVLVNVLLPIIGGAVYLGLCREGPVPAPSDVLPDGLPDLEHGPFELEGTQAVLVEAEAKADEAEADASLSSIVSFGTRVWFGSIASMVLDRSAPLLMVPLSDATNLGLYTVANTVSDLPLIVALAIAGALYGVNSKTTNIDQVTSTSRLSLLTCSIGCLFLVGTIHWWIVPLFGQDFVGATVPTVILTIGSLVLIPGLMAASALSAWGRPGLRSLGLAVTLVVSLVLFIVLVPPYGVYGAAWTELICSLLMSAMMVFACTRVIGVKASKFVLVGPADLNKLWVEGERVVVRLVLLLSRSRREHRGPGDEGTH